MQGRYWNRPIFWKKNSRMLRNKVLIFPYPANTTPLQSMPLLMSYRTPFPLPSSLDAPVQRNFPRLVRIMISWTVSGWLPAVLTLATAFSRKAGMAKSRKKRSPRTASAFPPAVKPAPYRDGCGRHYSDPDAAWGDSDNKTWFFGHTLQNFLYAIDDFGRHCGGLTPNNVCLDSAHDNIPTYELGIKIVNLFRNYL